MKDLFCCHTVEMKGVDGHEVASLCLEVTLIAVTMEAETVGQTPGLSPQSLPLPVLPRTKELWVGGQNKPTAGKAPCLEQLQPATPCRQCSEASVFNGP